MKDADVIHQFHPNLAVRVEREFGAEDGSVQAMASRNLLAFGCEDLRG